MSAFLCGLAVARKVGTRNWKKLGILTQPGGSASFQRKEQEKLQLKTRTPTVDSASVEFLNPFNAGKKALKTVEIPMEDRLERGKVFRDESEEYGPFAAAGTSQQGRRNSAQRVQHERAGADSADSISVLLREISTLMKQDSVHVVTAVCWLKALIHSHTSQLMALARRICWPTSAPVWPSSNTGCSMPTRCPSRCLFEPKSIRLSL
ncbi:hypothetical protein pipiens_003535 [Culex pipiens pipiens]|uniref:Uncharacterized protein n=1 Tax=Culex pipiens pipiens TaxID=38569 RepID=A0ABD1CWG0_CULPP